MSDPINAANIEEKSIKTASCSNVTSSSYEPTFLQSYCMGDQCVGEKTKTACESVDVVTITDGKLNSSWGQDSIGDCVWIESAPPLNQCQVKYR